MYLSVTQMGGGLASGGYPPLWLQGLPTATSQIPNLTALLVVVVMRLAVELWCVEWRGWVVAFLMPILGIRKGLQGSYRQLREIWP